MRRTDQRVLEGPAAHPVEHALGARVHDDLGGRHHLLATAGHAERIRAVDHERAHLEGPAPVGEEDVAVGERVVGPQHRHRHALGVVQRVRERLGGHERGESTIAPQVEPPAHRRAHRDSAGQGGAVAVEGQPSAREHPHAHEQEQRCHADDGERRAGEPPAETQRRERAGQRPQPHRGQGRALLDALEEISDHGVTSSRVGSSRGRRGRRPPRRCPGRRVGHRASA